MSTLGARVGDRIPPRLLWAVERVPLTPSSQVLEVGCGNGLALGLVAERLTTGTATGLDRSQTALTQARARLAEAEAAGRVQLVLGALESVALPRQFDTVFAVNVNAFWTTPMRSVPSLARLLVPTGRFWLVYEPPSGGREALEAKLRAGLAAAGATVLHFERARLAGAGVVGVLGAFHAERPGGA